MAIIVCSECGNQVSDKASNCPHCGNPIHSVQQDQQSTAYQQPHQQPFQQPYQQSYQQQPYQQPLLNPLSSNNEQRVERFLVLNMKKLPSYNITELKTWLLSLDANQMSAIECIELKDPTIMLVISFFLGPFGVDRFMLGDTKNGVFKLLLLIFFFLIITAIGSFVWWIIDMVKISDMTKDYNYEQIVNAHSYML